jgi:hypothetical protein
MQIIDPHFHNAVTNDKIQFDDLEAEDLDWKVKQSYTLMIVAASEIDNVVHQEAIMTTLILGSACQSITSKCFKLQHPTADTRRNTDMWRSVIGHGIYSGLVSS